MSERPLPYRPPEMEGFDEVKPSRVERGRTASVAGRDIHRRGQSSVGSPETVLESEAAQRLRVVLSVMAQRYARISEIGSILKSQNPPIELKDGDLDFILSAHQKLLEARGKAKPYIEDSTGTLVATPDFAQVQQEVRGKYDEIEAYLESLQGIVADLEMNGHEGNPFVVTDELRELLETKDVNPYLNEELAKFNPKSEDQKKLEAGEREQLESRVAKWQIKLDEWAGIRKEIIAVIGDRDFRHLLREFPVQGLAAGADLRALQREVALYAADIGSGYAPRDGFDRLGNLETDLDQMIAFGKVKLEELRTESESRSIGSSSKEELREYWRTLSPQAMLGAVEEQLAKWQEFDQQLQTLKSTSRVVDDLEAKQLGEKYESILSLTGRSEEIKEALGAIRQRFETQGKLDARDAGKLTALFYDYHELLATAEGILAERDRETPIVEKELAERKKEKKEDGTDPEHVQLVDRLKEVMATWDALYASIVAAKKERQLFKALRRKDEKVLLTEKERREIDGHLEELETRIAANQKIGRSQRWLERYRVGFERLKAIGEQILKEGPRELVVDKPADAVVTDEPTPSGEPAPRESTLVAFATGRPVRNEDEMTPWEKTDAREREAFIRELSTKEKDGYRRALAQKLTQMGITDRLKRDQLGKQAFENFMPARIQQLAKQSQFELTAEEVETLMVNLRKEFLVP